MVIKVQLAKLVNFLDISYAFQDISSDLTPIVDGSSSNLERLTAILFAVARSIVNNTHGFGL